MEKSSFVIEEASRVLDFWFTELSPSQWFEEVPALDRTIAAQFLTVHKAASRGELWPWRATPTGRLAEIIILDQFSRNIYRSTPKAYAYDGMALVLAQEALSVEADTALTEEQNMFLYMPFIHSESLAIHDIAKPLFDTIGLQRSREFVLRNRQIIERFGRFPNRNDILGRTSTYEEREFLAQQSS